MIPIEIINKILIYVSELNNDMIITQYDVIRNKEYYKINLKNDLLWKIKSSIVMKKLYPVRIGCNSELFNKNYIELYKFGIPHYEKELREKRMI